MARRVPVLVAVVGLLLASCATDTGRAHSQNRVPEPAAAASLAFSAAADYGVGRTTARTLRRIGTDGGAFHLAVGDLSYGALPEPAWCRYVTERVGPTMPVQLLAGNHDTGGSDGDIDAFVRCLPNRVDGVVGRYGRQWYIDVPQDQPLVRIVMISPGLRLGGSRWSYRDGSKRYRWTARAVDGARAAGIPWVVVGAHMPCLSMGRYGCGSGADITTLLLSRRVDVVLHGHEHLYQRTKQLRLGRGCRALPVGRFDRDCVADRDSTLVAGRGTTFVTVGTGGRPLRPVSLDDPERRYFARWSGSNVDPRHGFLRLEVSQDTLDVRFVGSTRGGFSDSFTLTRPA